MGAPRNLSKRKSSSFSPPYPSLSSIAVFDLGKPGAYLEAEAKAEASSIKKDVQSKGPQLKKVKGLRIHLKQLVSQRNPWSRSLTNLNLLSLRNRADLRREEHLNPYPPINQIHLKRQVI